MKLLRPAAGSAPRRVLAVPLALGALGASGAWAAQAGSPALNNVTSLDGTWSSGSGQVTTGLEFFNPADASFHVPKTSGIAYSFTPDGFFEESKYIYTSNATQHRCIKASLSWQHGTYTINSNQSLSLQPWKTDGKVMVMDVCAKQSVQQYYYFQPTLIPMWYNFLEPDAGHAPWADTKQNADPAFALQMYQDGGGGQAGTKMPVLYLQARPPNMLPPVPLMENVLDPVATGGKSSPAATQTGAKNGLGNGAWDRRDGRRPRQFQS